MAGDWIPFQLDLPRKPEIVRIAARTGMSRREAAMVCLEFWGWVSSQSVDGRVDVPVDALPSLIPDTDQRFWDAMVAVGWLVASEGAICVPRSDRWVTKGAKARLSKNIRQSRWREQSDDDAVDVPVDADVDARVDAPVSTKASTTEQNSTVSSSSEEDTSYTHNRVRVRRTAPPDFELTSERLAFATTEGLTEDRARREFAKMRDYTFRSGHKDWDAVWRNWVRRAAESMPVPSRASPAQGGPHTTAAARTMQNVREFLREGTND